MKNLICVYCGRVKKEVSFFIGASLKPNWTMHEGTGKISCPDCYNIASVEAKLKIEQHIKSVNKINKLNQ